MPTTAPQNRHTVTAIIVAHDGARLLPGLVQALRAQTRPADQTVAVDTGSRDRSGALLGDLIGPDAVIGLPRLAGYGEAVAVALRHAARLRGDPADPGRPRTEWIWLLHDDCEPAPEALERLLRAADKDRAVVLGPKVLDGQDRRTLREVGVSIDRAGRRVTGIEPGEIDQGQHDHKQAVLAVSSAGMLIRREVWDRLGGFDPSLGVFRDDVDFCWRVQGAGLRVHVVTDAVLYHRELSYRGRRPIANGSARLADRRNALYVLAANLPLLAALRIVGGAVIGSLARAFWFLLTKQLDLAAAYALSVAGLFGHPVRLLRARRRRRRGLSEGYNAVRVFIPPARTLFKLAEKIAGLISNGPPQATGGRHQAAVEESEEDQQFTDGQPVLRRVAGHPGVQLFAALLVVSLVAERRLLGTSPLGGGALVPAWGGAAALWHEYLAGFHTVGVGSTASAPPYLAVVAALATVLGGQAWLAVDVLLLGCVPLAGLTAYLACRKLVTAAPARVLLAACYALLPVATGAVAAGRLGTAVAFVTLPLIADRAGRMLTATPRKAYRAAWAAGLLIALASAFAPVVWVFGVLLALAMLAARRWLVAVTALNAAIVALTPVLVLFPWSLHLLASPSGFLSEAGLSAPGLVTSRLSPTALLALSPGGPGMPPLWVTAGFGLALVAVLLPGAVRGRGLVITGWAVAVAGLLTATVVSRISVTPAAGGQPADSWPGTALALAALGLLLAAAPTAQRLAEFRLSSGPDESAQPSPDESGHLPLRTAAATKRGGTRRVLAWAALAAAASAPVLVAAYWVADGVRGPVGAVSAPVLPAFVSASSVSDEQYRTLILRSDGSAALGSGLDYQVVRQADPTLGEPELSLAPAAEAALSGQVAALGSADGADAGDPGLVLGDFGIRYVLLPGPVDPVLAQRLDAAVGLVALSKAPTYDLWQVAGPVGRVRVVAANGTTTVLSSGAVDLSGAAAPASGGTLLLAEPYGGWMAKLNGHPLQPLAKPVDGWAQGFVLPAGGGQLSVTRSNLPRDLSLLVELIALLASCILALPGKRADPVQEAQALAALREAREGKRAAGTARPASTTGASHRVGVPDRPGHGRRRRGDQSPAPGLNLDTAPSLDPAAAPGFGLAAAPELNRDTASRVDLASAESGAVADTTTAGLDQEPPSVESAEAGNAAAASRTAWERPGYSFPDERARDFLAEDRRARDAVAGAADVGGPAMRAHQPADTTGAHAFFTDMPDDLAYEPDSFADPAGGDAPGADAPGWPAPGAKAPGADAPGADAPSWPAYGADAPSGDARGAAAPGGDALGAAAPSEERPDGDAGAAGLRADSDDGSLADAPSAAWDTAGDWDSASSISLDDEISRLDALEAWLASPIEDGPKRWDDVLRLTGAQSASPPADQQPAVSPLPAPETQGPGTPRPASPLAEPQPAATPVLETPEAPAGPWETSQQPSAWDSEGWSSEFSSGTQPRRVWESESPASEPVFGTQPRPVWESEPVSEPAVETESRQVWNGEAWVPESVPGTRPYPAWGSGAQSPVSAAGAQQRPVWDSWPARPAAPTGEQPAARTGAQPVAVTAEQPTARTGGQPRARTAGQRAARTTEQPETRAGAQPAGPPSWGAGDWDRTPDRAGTAGTGAGPAPVPPAPVPPEPSPGGSSPAATPQPGKPSRGAHRAKHGRPSRWSNFGNRSGDGNS